ncbi:MAG TPA: MMPL family transporter [Planctomycetaceae bacterium]|nr:MMPL family transporter [Planctomycetaceae bacterium]
MNWFRGVVDFLIRRRNVLAIIAIALALASIYPALELTFDQSIESLYAPDDPLLRNYLESKDLFGGDEFVAVAYTDPDLLSDAGKARVKKLSEELERVPGVSKGSTQSLTTLLEDTRFPFMKKRLPEILEFGRGLVISADHRSTAVIVRLQDQASAPVPRAETIAELRRIAAEQPEQAYVVGEPVLVSDVFRYSENDGELMGWAATGLLIVVILIFLRGMRWVILPFLIVRITIVWTKASLTLSGIQLSMVSSALTSLVTIIGVSTVVYMSLYYRKLREQHSPVESLRKMLDVLGIDIFWVCATTAAGFGAGLSSHIHPVQSLAIMMILGSMFVLLSMALLLPAGILIGTRSKPVRPLGEQQVSRFMAALTNWSVAHPWGIALGALALIAFSTVGLFRLHVETDFSKNFRKSAPIVQAFDFAETKLGGAGAWEVNFPAPHELDDEYLAKVSHLAQQLRDLKIDGEHPLTKVVAVTDGVELVPKLPLITSTLAARMKVLDGLQPEFLPSLYNAKEGRMRIMLRSRERSAAEDKERLIAQVESVARADFPEAKATGLYVMLTYLIQSLLGDQWINLAWGVAGILLMMSLAYRSLWFGIIALASNVLPILIVIGAMGWIGLKVNLGTAMISSDAMGLTVHDAIFYLSAYLRARRSGHSFDSALQETQTEVRKPLIYSNVALMLGFLVLTMSHFIPMVYFGCLVSAAILGGLISNLVLLPPMLKLHAMYSERGLRARAPAPQPASPAHSR